jgi:glycosyltransferase involved in cell wall biosynthesis
VLERPDIVRDLVRKHGARDQQLTIVYCGIELDKFAPPSTSRPRDGKLRILSSGRLVAKKGFKDLIAACGIIADRGIDLECIIAGSGPLQQALQKQIDELKLTDRVKLTGQEIKQEDIPAFMHTGDIYCLPCIWAEDGDIDGLPQMLMEAMACGLPAISTRLVGIPDLCIHEKTGLLVEPGNLQQIAEAIIRLQRNPDEAQRLAREARRWIEQKFDLATSLDPLIALFRAKLAANQPQTPHTCCPRAPPRGVRRNITQTPIASASPAADRSAFVLSEGNRARFSAWLLTSTCMTLSHRLNSPLRGSF